MTSSFTKITYIDPESFSQICFLTIYGLGFPGGSAVKNPPANAGDTGDSGSVLGLGSSPGGGHGNPLHYSCLENRWTKEPGRLQSMVLQRVGQDWACIYNNRVLEISTFCSLTARNSATFPLFLTKSSVYFSLESGQIGSNLCLILTIIGCNNQCLSFPIGWHSSFLWILLRERECVYTCVCVLNDLLPPNF